MAAEGKKDKRKVTAGRRVCDSISWSMIPASGKNFQEGLLFCQTCLPAGPPVWTCPTSQIWREFPGPALVAACGEAPRRRRNESRRVEGASALESRAGPALSLPKGCPRHNSAFPLLLSRPSWNLIPEASHENQSHTSCESLTESHDVEGVRLWILVSRHRGMLTTGLPKGKMVGRMKATDWTTVGYTYDPAVPWVGVPGPHRGPAQRHERSQISYTQRLELRRPVHLVAYWRTETLPGVHEDHTL
jgi:hypothetical protein